jgi:hypothetical protein
MLAAREQRLRAGVKIDPAARRVFAPPYLEAPMSHETYDACIAACHTCADACDHCAATCLEEADVQGLAACIRLDIDCSGLCRLAAAFMARGSAAASALCQVCAELCEACAEECERHPLEHCRRCAEACRHCAAECRRMGAEQPRTSLRAHGGAAAH